ncbi:hypothetical protein D3C78_1301470 [compost metagenome]
MREVRQHFFDRTLGLLELHRDTLLIVQQLIELNQQPLHRRIICHKQQLLRGLALQQLLQACSHIAYLLALSAVLVILNSIKDE